MAMTTQEKPKLGFFERLKAGLARTRKNFMRRLTELLSGSKIDDEMLEELEALLVTADFGVETSTSLIEEARERLRGGDDPQALKIALKETIRERLAAHVVPISWTARPHVVLVVGVNGVGKTTTIGKLAHHFRQEGKKVILAAGDTFRAAAVQQLATWAERAGTELISQGQDADAASVIFDAFSAARARDADILIADTAGRLHTKVNLMEELKKIKRVLARLDPLAPHEILLVLDATTGQNAVSQAKQFSEAVGVTGLVVTKLDGTAKGGVVVSVCERFGLPLRYVGVGEGMDDLRPFNAEDFVNALFAEEEPADG